MSRLSENLAVRGDANAVTKSAPQAVEFTPEQRRALLDIAHTAIVSALAGEPLGPALPAAAPFSSFPLTQWPSLLEPRGVFTTLYLQGALRGCVGYAVPHGPLYRAVAETARAAAFEDSRFWPVTAEEAPQLKISLSVLSPLFPIAAELVEVGRHGLVISDGGRRGLLLPQVPVEHGWDRETFLGETCHKAGLPVNAWQMGAKIEAFTAEVFGDDEVPA